MFPLYTIPVALSTRFLGTLSGVFVSFLSAGAWVQADRWSGHVYSQDWFLGVNAFNRLCRFVLAVVAIRYIQERRTAMDLRLRGHGRCAQLHAVRTTVRRGRPLAQHSHLPR